MNQRWWWRFTRRPLRLATFEPGQLLGDATTVYMRRAWCRWWPFWQDPVHVADDSSEPMQPTA